VPLVGLVTFPHRLVRPRNPLYNHLAAYVPQHDWEYLPRDCMGGAYGPPELKRIEFLLDLADDFVVFALGMAGVGIVLALSTVHHIVSARRQAQVTLWTFVNAILAILCWSEAWCRGLGSL